MNRLAQDIRYAYRTLAAQPAFTLVAVAVLAIAIGANTAVFAGLNAIVLRPLPYADAGRLFMVRESRLNAEFARTVVAPGEFLQWAGHRELFDSVVAVDYPGVAVAVSGAEPETLSGLLAQASFFDVFRPALAIGRPFSPEEDRPGRALAVVIGFDYWQRRFGGDAAIAGRAIHVNAQPATIVGVLPRGFAFNGAVDIVVPAQYGAAEAADFSDHFLDVIARLRPGVSREAAEVALSAFVREHQAAPPHAKGVTLLSLKDAIVGSTSGVVWLLLGAVGCVLAIACANIANLLLARATTRRREIALRAALGAGRGQIVRQFLTESVLLAGVAGGFGLLLSLWGVDLLAAISPAATPRIGELDVDFRVLIFAIGITLATGVLFGVAPAIHAAQMDVNEALKLDGRSGSGARQPLLRAFAAAEIALALALLVGAGLLAGSLRRLNDVDPGFRSDHVVTLNVAPPERAYPTADRRLALYDRLLERVHGLPGVTAAGLVNVLPLNGSNSSGAFTIDGAPPPTPANRPNADLRSVTPEYFAAMGIPIIRGRGFTAADGPDAPRVAVINQTTAAKFWPGTDAIGKRLKRGRPESAEPWITIVGVVGNVHHRALRTEPRQELYFPFAQDPRLQMVLAVRTAGDPATAIAPLRAALHDIDPELPADGIQLMGDIVAASLQVARFSSSAVGAFAAVALLLALIGIYGVMSFGVSQRTREIGVRMALGARPGDVVGLVLRQALRVVVVGVSAGVLGAAALAQAMTSLLFGLSATDAPTYVVVALVLIAAAAGASVAPAYRATRIDPIVALRD
jgi:putative ABC transport system permease protein